MDEQQLGRYAIAMEVLDELLPDHEFLGPVFDDKITVLRAKIEAVSNEIRTELANAVQKFPDAGQGTELRLMYDTFRSDIAEMRDMLQALEQRLEKAGSPAGPVPAEISIEKARVAETLRGAAEKLKYRIIDFQRLEALIGATIFNFGFAGALTNVALLNQITVLRRLLAALRQAGGEAAKETSLPRAILKSLPAPGAEHAAEKSGEVLIGDTIQVLLPIGGILTDGFKRWREAKVRPEESIALVKLLIGTREVIRIWETGGLVMRPRKERELNVIAVEEFRSIANENRRQWLQERPGYRIAGGFSGAAS